MDDFRVDINAKWRIENKTLCHVENITLDVSVQKIYEIIRIMSFKEQYSDFV